MGVAEFVLEYLWIKIYYDYGASGCGWLQLRVFEEKLMFAANDGLGCVWLRLRLTFSSSKPRSFFLTNCMSVRNVAMNVKSCLLPKILTFYSLKSCHSGGYI